jgi:hypothetical protein
MAASNAMEQIQRMSNTDGMNQGGAMLPQQVAASAGATAMVLASHQRAMLQGRDLVVVEDNLVKDFMSWDKDDKGIYELPYGTHPTGLSIRAAEQVHYRMGHFHSDSSMTKIGDDVQVLVSVTDLVNNNTVPCAQTAPGTVERKKQADDRALIGTRKNTQGDTLYIYPATAQELKAECQKAQSLAWRTCIWRLTPPNLRKTIFQTIKQAEAKMFSTSKPKAIADIVAMGNKLRPSVSAKQMSEYLGHSMEDLTSEEFVELRQTFKAIEEGAVTWREVQEQKDAKDGVEPAVGVVEDDLNMDVAKQPQPKTQQSTGAGLPGMSMGAGKK